MEDLTSLTDITTRDLIIAFTILIVMVVMFFALNSWRKKDPINNLKISNLAVGLYTLLIILMMTTIFTGVYTFRISILDATVYISGLLGLYAVLLTNQYQFTKDKPDTLSFNKIQKLKKENKQLKEDIRLKNKLLDIKNSNK